MTPIADCIESTPAGPQQDEAAVAAVRAGDAGRYRELVERHQRRVYAVAWSRLGDAALAEEATQEAFIRAYRSLPLLGDGAKICAWIGAITRNLAVSLGLRHRRELNKRERWALEQPATETATTPEDEICPPEMLRQTLAELPAAHRECLVLFYLEGKSGAEAAAALGIAETALRMRLSRARAALREKLEARLGQSLQQLRPSATLTPSVMAIITSTSSVKMAGGTGVGATVMAALGKILPFKLAVLFVPLLGMAPGVGLAWWMSRAEQGNYRDADGFRARLHRNFFRRMLWFIGAVLLGTFVFAYAGIHFMSLPVFFLGMGVFSLVMMGFMVRSLVINRSRFHLGIFLNAFINTLGMLAIGLGWMPTSMFAVSIILGMVALIPAMRGRPLRMDYSLFLRAAQGMLPNPAGNERAAAGAGGYNRAQLLAFARFLGSRFLVINYRWAASGLQLCLPNATYLRPRFSQMVEVILLRWQKSSWMELGWDGTVRAHCSGGDAALLQAMDGPAKAPAAELETRVAGAVAGAWSRFRAGDGVAAERMVGQVPDAEVFLTPPARSKGYRIWAGFVLISLAVLTCSEIKIHGLMLSSPTQGRVQALINQDNELIQQVNEKLAEENQLGKENNEDLKQVEALFEQARSASPADALQINEQIAPLREQMQTNRDRMKEISAEVNKLTDEEHQNNVAVSQLLHPNAVPAPQK